MADWDTGSIAIVARSATITASVTAVAGNSVVRVCGSLPTLERAQAAMPLDLVVLEMGLSPRLDYPREVAAVLGTVRCPVIIATETWGSVSREALRIAQARPDAVFPFNTGDELQRAVSAVKRAEHDDLGVARVIERIGSSVPARAREFFCASTVLCQWRCNVALVDRALVARASTGRARVAGANALPRVRQVRWQRALYAIRRTCDFEWSEKRAALVGGYPRRTALPQLVESCTGLTVTAWRRLGGFEPALEMYASVWARCPASATPL